MPSSSHQDKKRTGSAQDEGEHVGTARKSGMRKRRQNSVRPTSGSALLADNTDGGSSEPEIADVTRRFLFDEKALRAGPEVDELFDDPPAEDFNEIVDWDDERVEHYVRKQLIGVMIESLPFRLLILALIVTNSALIALQTDERYSVKWTYEFSIFDKVVLVIFVCEILLKWYYDFWLFWKSYSNILDLFIVCVLFLGPNVMMGNGKTLKVLRVLRAFSSLKGISAFAGLQMVIQTILQSLPDMANIGLLLFIILVVLAVVGVTLFQDVFPNSFGDLGKALFSLFICVTEDGWITIFKDFEAKGGSYYYGGMLYFCVAIMICSFVFANLIVAIVVTNLEYAINEIKMKQQREQDAMLSLESTESNHDFADDNIPIITATSLSRKDKVHFQQQTPLELPNFDNLNEENIENYFLFLIALEENLKEYNLIRNDMEQMFAVIQEFNVVEANDASVSPNRIAPELLPNFDVDLTKGDILSNLIKLEGANVISSKNGNNLSDAIRHATFRK